MTLTTASPSRVLLGSTTSPTKAAPAADAGAAPDKASSGFELLVQHLQKKLPANAAKTDGAAASLQSSDKSAADSGNALPLLGSILPLTMPGQAPSDTAATADAAGSQKSKEEKDQDGSVAVTDPMLPAGLIIQPRLNANATSESTEAMASMDKNAALRSPSRLSGDSKKTDELALSIPVASGNSTETDKAKTVAPTDTDSTAASANAIASMLSGGVTDSRSNNSKTDTKAAEPLSTSDIDVVSNAADINTGAGSATALVKEIQGASKHLAESDFDALVKHLDAASNTQSAPSTVIVGDSASTHQASRAYVNAASNTTATVSVPVGNSGWGDAVADKVMWFSANKISSAEIHLNPPDLGPLQVRVSTQHDQTSVVFTSQHAAVRDALDQALPRLRDMMGSQGMHLLDVSVGGQSAQQQQQQQQQFTRNGMGDRAGSFGGLFADDPDPTQTAVATVTTVNSSRLIRSGVDAYA